MYCLRRAAASGRGLLPLASRLCAPPPPLPPPWQGARGWSLAVSHGLSGGAGGDDRILLRGLIFYGRHGALPEEQVLGQRFRVDLDLRLDLRRAGATDDLGDTVNYAEVHSLVQGVMEGPPVQLLERAAELIAAGVLGGHPKVSGVTVAIRKPSVPIPAALDCVGVEISRSRTEEGPDSQHSAFAKLFDLGRVLGSGGFGEVRYAVKKETGEKCAVKIVTVPEGRRAARLHTLIKQEVSILKKCNHTNIIRLQEVYRLGPTYYLVMELGLGGEVLDEVMRKPYTESEARELMRELVDGVAYLHRRGIVHRDLKLENLLLRSRDSRCTGVKIGDFGLAAEVGSKPLKSMSGSVLYVAPEVLACADDPGASYDERVDVWSLGVCLYILLSREAPFDSEGHDMLDRIATGRFKFGSPAFREVSHECKGLIRAMLTPDREERITIGELAAHPWLRDPALRGPWDSAESAVPRVKELRKGSHTGTSPLPGSATGGGESERACSPGELEGHLTALLAAEGLRLKS